jgi:hypothetical protein
MSEDNKKKEEYTWKTNVAAGALFLAIYCWLYGGFALLVGQPGGLIFGAIFLLSYLLVYRTVLRGSVISHGGTAKKVMKSLLILVLLYIGIIFATFGHSQTQESINERERIAQKAIQQEVKTTQNLKQSSDNASNINELYQNIGKKSEASSEGKDQSQPLAADLEIIRNEINKKTPIILNTGMRLDEVSVGSSSISYQYTITDEVPSRIENMIRNGKFRNDLQTGACTRDSIRAFRENNVEMNYEYLLPSGDLINKFTLQPGNCK